MDSRLALQILSKHFTLKVDFLQAILKVHYTLKKEERRETETRSVNTISKNSILELAQT